MRLALIGVAALAAVAVAGVALAAHAVTRPPQKVAVGATEYAFALSKKTVQARHRHLHAHQRRAREVHDFKVNGKIPEVALPRRRAEADDQDQLHEAGPLPVPLHDRRARRSSGMQGVLIVKK